ncbi:MAG: hypothetical protein II937_17675 [Bacteroidales bacterium]|nr:hypothetical protein [Bacteroidales bacterium]
MEALKKDILTALSNESVLIGGGFEQYCKTFFNRCSKDNRCIIFGIKKQELLTELFGFSFPILINDDVHYLVRIKSSKTPEVQITFGGNDGGYTDEQQEWFRALYSHYNADKNINLGLFFLQKRKVPPLTVKDDWATEFMNNPNDNFRYLDGDKLIEKVEIKHPKVIDVELYKSLDDVFLIPEKYLPYAEYKKAIQQNVETQKTDSDDWLKFVGNFLFGSENDADNHKTDFWKKFSENVCDVERINFAILNHNDDFMVLTFYDLITQYQRKFANFNLLKRIFFVYDESAKSTKAAAQKGLPDSTKKLFNELHNSLRKIETNEFDCALYVCALEYLENLDSKIKQKTEKTLSDVKNLLFKELKKNLLK